jgi:pyrroline-5-carboxylate reductase
MKRITIIGGGNLGQSIALGLIRESAIRPEDLIVTRRNTQLLSPLAAMGVQVMADNAAAVSSADIVVLAVKPFQTASVLQEIQSSLSEGVLILSVVTGVSLKELRQGLGSRGRLVRAMPNTAIAIRESMTCLCSEPIEPAQRLQVDQLFQALGKSVWIEEDLMDAATVLGACGTAFAMRYIRANIQGGIEIGFDARTASLIAAQTIKGAAELLLQLGTHPESEIDKVTTPKGCTIAGLNEMEHQGFSSSLIKGLLASYQKIKK